MLRRLTVNSMTHLQYNPWWIRLEKTPSKRFSTFKPYLRPFWRCFHHQLLIEMFRFCAVLEVMETSFWSQMVWWSGGLEDVQVELQDGAGSWRRSSFSFVWNTSKHFCSSGLFALFECLTSILHVYTFGLTLPAWTSNSLWIWNLDKKCSHTSAETEREKKECKRGKKKAVLILS